MIRIGIDLGGTFIKAGTLDKESNLLSEETVPTMVAKGGDFVVKNMATVICSVLKKSGHRIEEVQGIGIGCPGVIDQKRGIVLYSNNFDWNCFHVIEKIEKLIPADYAIANDGKCAVLGEQIAGAGQGCDNLILLTLGTGVGCGIISGGKLFEGGSIGGGIAGHMVIRHGGETCTCGRNGCLEAYASATALIRETRKLFENHDEIVVHLCMGNPTNITGQTVFLASAQGDKKAMEVIQRYIEFLGDGIANLIDIFRPEKVLLGGGICNEGEKLFAPLNEYIRRNCFASDILDVPPVKQALLGNKAGIIGAASLIGEKNEQGI